MLRDSAPMSPFDLSDPASYRLWREAKLDTHPARAEDLMVEVGDARALTAAERMALLGRCASANMALYLTRGGGEPDKDIPRLLGRQLGLERLDGNWLADEDGISSITPVEGGTRGEFIPYTDRPIRWHTDGYYNPRERRILGMILHCVRSAAEGGENRLLDPEIAYILLRDEAPALVAALMADDAMSIPARTDETGVARAAESGPVFSVLESGHLHMRYTARRVSVAWKDDPVTTAAVAALERILDGNYPWVFRVRMEPGMGLVCNNVLHDRAAFRDSPQRRRLLYRARYYDRVGERKRVARAA